MLNLFNGSNGSYQEMESSLAIFDGGSDSDIVLLCCQISSTVCAGERYFVFLSQNNNWCQK